MVKVWQFVTVVAVLATNSVYAKRKNDNPGACDDSDDCKDDYQCVALQTTRSGTEEVKQCLPMKNGAKTCSGTGVGLCPSFSSWEAPYNEISSVCSYIPASLCTSSASKSASNAVDCVSGVTDSDGKTLDVIYGCVDFDMSKEKLLFGKSDDSDKADKIAKKLGTSDAVIKGCMPSDSEMSSANGKSTSSSSAGSDMGESAAGTVNAGEEGRDSTGGSARRFLEEMANDSKSGSGSGSSSKLLCSGHGTCTPVGSSMYQCQCNIGYGGDVCEEVSSDKCALPGQCLTGECDLDEQVCKCEEGSTGNQCSKCDPKSSKACSGHGKCSDDGVCTCEEGREGKICDKKVSSGKKGGDDDADNGDGKDGASMTSVSAVAAMSMVLLAFMQ